MSDKKLKIGSFVRADNSGLGALAWEFEKHLLDKVVIVPNGKYRTFPERYKNYKIGLNNVDWLLSDIDTLLLFETPYKWEIIPKARKKGVKVVMMPMHECLREPVPYQSDLYICVSPSEMNLTDIEPKVRLNMPVNTDVIKWRKRDKAKVFVHNAGHGGVNQRNGTLDLLNAMKYVQSDIRLKIKSQSFKFESEDPRVECEWVNHKNYWDIWQDGDVFVFPEKWNGLSLPVQEAFASGMAVITTKKEDFSFLPQDILLDVGWTRATIARTVNSAIHSPVEIAKKIDKIANQDISEYSLAGKKWAQENNWQVLSNKYLEVLK